MSGPARRARNPQSPGLVVPWAALRRWVGLVVLLGPVGVVGGLVALWLLWVGLDLAAAHHLTFGMDI